MTLAIQNETPILSYVCFEPDGNVTREVRFMTLELENLKVFWEKARKFKTLFGEEISGDFHKFVNVFLRTTRSGDIEPMGLFWVIDDFVGVFYMTQIQVMQDAVVHYSFFDGRTRGRAPLARAMMKYAFEQYGFNRLTVEIPFFAVRTAFKFVEEIGFVHEGRKRKAVRYNGELFDVNCFGILRDEVL